MKINQLLVLATAAAAVTSSCQKAPIAEQAISKAVTFSSTIANQVTTKAVGANWENNDAIGVFMKTGSGLSNVLASNKQYVTANGDGNFKAGSTTEELMYPTDGSNVDFIAYYPYQTSISNNTYPVNVSDQTQQNKIDLLYANNVTAANVNTANAQLQFSHKLSKVNLTITAGKGVSTLNGLTVTYNGFNTTANFDLATGTLAAAANPADIKAKITSGATSTTAEAILLPVSNVAGAKVFFKIGNDTYTWTLPSTTVYDAGKKYSYTITLQEDAGTNKAVVASGSITDWTDVPSGSYTIGKDQDNGGGTTNPVEQTLFAEDFGATAVSSNTKIAAFTGWSNTSVKYTDQFANADIRKLSATAANPTNHVWLPANKDSEIAIEGINMDKATQLKLTFDAAANVFNSGASFDFQYIDITINGQVFHAKSQVVTAADKQANIFFPVEIDLSGVTSLSSNSKLTISTTTANNAIGIRIDNIVLKGLK